MNNAASDVTTQNARLPHICVCIPTYKREDMLARLLTSLAGQQTDGRFDFSVLVVDNDSACSAKPATACFSATGGIRTRYVSAPQKNVAIARNVALDNACGDLVAFIDDDEIPGPEWLCHLYGALMRYNADGVLGPVRPVFDTPPPRWVLRARLFDRSSHATGTVLHWKDTRTGNVLLRRSVFANPAHRFNAFFKHSEDKDFFRRMTERHFMFVWCEEAVVFESETADRFSMTYQLRRALVRGNAAMRHCQFSPAAILKSTTAVIVYLPMLAVLAVAGGHLWRVYLIKLCDHVGALLAVARVDLIDYFGGA